ncbi:MAG: hypothetical protein ACI8ZN_001744 [Bacteroidia bacterium]|jgi:hypothetical protein
MKLKNILPLTLLLLIAIPSCKDDDDKVDVTKPTTVELVQNIWNIHSVIDYNYVGKSTTLDYIDTILIGNAGTFDFRSDNRVYAYVLGDYDTSAYAVINDGLIDFDGEAYEITSITSSQFVLTFKERTEDPYFNNVVTLKR